MVGFNVLSTLGTAKPLFNSNVGNTSDTYPIEVTPAGWVFSIVWTTIFIWQYVWLIYAVTTLFRKDKDGEYIYLNNDFIHWGILIAFAVNNSVVIAWLFLWDKFLFGWALLMIAASAISLHVCLFISLRKGYNDKEKMIENGLKNDVWMNRFILQNGIAFYLTWLSLATNLNFAIFLTYDASIEVSISSTVALICILIIIVAYWVVENFIYPRYFLYIYTPWFVLNLALIGSVSKNYVSAAPTRNNIMTVILLVHVIIFTIVKVVLNILYHTKWAHKVHSTCLCRRSTEEKVGHADDDKLEKQ